MRFKIFLIIMTALYLTFMFQIGAFAADLNKVYVESGYSKNNIKTELGEFVSNGIDMSVGYEVNNNLDIKIGYHDFGKDTEADSFIIQYNEHTARVSGQVSLETKSVSLGIKPKLNIGNYINVFTEVGLHKWYGTANLKLDGQYKNTDTNEFETAYLSTGVTDSGYDTYYGIGAELEVGALRIGVTNKIYNADDLELDSLVGFIGFTKKF